MVLKQPLTVFISYSHKDEQHRSDLEAHLSLFRKNGLINEWHDRKITPGDDGDKEIDEQLDRADIVLLLVSADFIKSMYCWEKELTRSLDRHEAGRTVVVPIIVRAVHLQGAPFERIQSLPTDRRAITSWSNRDEAWVDVVKGVQEVIDKINAKRQRLQRHHEAEQVSDVVRKNIEQVEPIASLLSKAVDSIDELHRTQSSVTGVSTGFIDLDDQTSGLQPSDLVVVAGRPSMGKTTLATNIAENAAIGHKIPIAIFSMEMPGTQLATRMMASLGRINLQRVRTGKLDDDDWPRLTAAVTLLNDAPIFIDDTPALSPTELRNKALKIKSKHGLGLVIVDYLQLMEAAGMEAEDRASQISSIVRALKGLAGELNVPIIVISQLNRSVEQRTDKRPIMADLGESETIEEDADLILFVYRDEVYNEDSPNKGIAEIIIGKQRKGPVGTVILTFLGEYAKFENYTSGN